MNARVSALAACGVVLFGGALTGCGSKSNSASSPAAGTAARSASSAASYNNTASPQGQRYQEAIKQSGSTKSPYSR